MLDDLTRIMQDMDTQASNDLEVVFDSTTTNQGLQVRSKDCLFSRGGSAPVELGNSDTEDEEQDHVEVINLTVTEVTQEAAAVTTAEVTPPELPLTLDQVQADEGGRGLCRCQHGHQDEEEEAPGGEAPQELGCQEEGEAEEGQAGHLCDPQEEDRYLWLDSWFNPN